MALKTGDKVIRLCPFCKKDAEWLVTGFNGRIDSWVARKASCVQPGDIASLNLSPTTLQMRD